MVTRLLAPLHGARRIAVWLALTGLWAAATLYFLSNADRPRSPRPPTSDGIGTGGGPAIRQAPAGAPPLAAPGGEPASAPPEVVQGLPEARRVAAAFATAYATWRYDETPQAAAARLVPHVTPELAARLEAPASGATAARRSLAQQAELSTAVVEAVQTQALSADGIALLVLVRQEVHTATGVETRRPSYAVRLSPEGGRWLVRDFTP